MSYGTNDVLGLTAAAANSAGDLFVLGKRVISIYILVLRVLRARVVSWPGSLTKVDSFETPRELPSVKADQSCDLIC